MSNEKIDYCGAATVCLLPFGHGEDCWESVEKHGIMTDGMIELAELLGLNDGKHTADTIARAAVLP